MVPSNALCGVPRIELPRGFLRVARRGWIQMKGFQWGNFSCFCYIQIATTFFVVRSKLGCFGMILLLTICGTHSLEGDSAAETFKHVRKRKSMYPTVGVHDVHVT